MLGKWVGGSGDVLLSGDAPFHLCIAHVWLTRDAGDGGRACPMEHVLLARAAGYPSEYLTS